MDNLMFHHVKELSVRPVRTAKDSESYQVQELLIEKEDGTKVEIILFSDDHKTIEQSETMGREYEVY